jgi:hypothetical protein
MRTLASRVTALVVAAAFAAPLPALAGGPIPEQPEDWEFTEDTGVPPRLPSREESYARVDDYGGKAEHYSEGEHGRSYADDGYGSYEKRQGQYDRFDDRSRYDRYADHGEKTYDRYRYDGGNYGGHSYGAKDYHAKGYGGKDYGYSYESRHAYAPKTHDWYNKDYSDGRDFSYRSYEYSEETTDSYDRYDGGYDRYAEYGDDRYAGHDRYSDYGDDRYADYGRHGAYDRRHAYSDCGRCYSYGHAGAGSARAYASARASASAGLAVHDSIHLSDGFFYGGGGVGVEPSRWASGGRIVVGGYGGGYGYGYAGAGAYARSSAFASAHASAYASARGGKGGCGGCR